jgi:hypothetical protein
LPRSLEALHRQIIQDAWSESVVPFARFIPFPRWKLYPARVVFIALKAITSLLVRFR